MKKILVKWIEHHSAIVEVKDAEEAYAAATEKPSGITRDSWSFVSQEERGETFCECHRRVISEDDPCEECAREAHEEHASDLAMEK